MRRIRSLAGLGVTAMLALAPLCATAGAAVPVPRSSSLTVFPTQDAVELRRGDVVERTVGVRQSGAPGRTVRLELSGAADGFVAVLAHDDPTVGVTTLSVPETGPAFVVVRIAPGPAVPDGHYAARLRAVDEAGTVAVGSELVLDVAVKGDRDLRASVIDARPAATSVEVGGLLRLLIDVDVAGNTPLAPAVSMQLDGPSGPIASLDARPAPAPAGRQSRLEVSWPTTGWALGKYDGVVTVRAGDTEIGRREVHVEVVAVGSMPRSVSVLSARAVEDVRKGGLAKVLVTVRNDGGLDGRVVFVGELWHGGRLVAPVRGEPVLLAAGEEHELVVYAPIAESGAYRLQGRANLEGAESGTVAVELEATSPAQWPWVPIAMASGLAAALGALALLRSRQLRRRRPRPRPSPGHTGASVHLKPRRA
jgi:hypothetical protein